MRATLLIAAVCLAGCRHSAPTNPRLLHVRAAADSGVQQRANWKELLKSRIETACAKYTSAFSMQCEISSIVEWTPEANTPPDALRRALSGEQTDGNWLLVGFLTAPADATEPGIAVPFDPRVLVYDFPGKSEKENTANLAHELGHTFGAWDSTSTQSVMHVPPGEEFDRTTASLLDVTRTNDFRVAPIDMKREFTAAITKVVTSSKADAASNPLFRALSTNGYELMTRGRPQDAVEPLARAAELVPADPKVREVLGLAMVAMQKYKEAASQFRKLVEISPKSAVAYNNLAFALLQSQQPEEALAALQKARKYAPESGTLHANIGVTLGRIPGHLDESIEELRQAIRINPSDQVTRAALDAAIAAKSKGAR